MDRPVQNKAVIALGSNIDPGRHIQEARAEIRRRFRVLAESGFVMTRAVGPPGQPDFLNGAVLVETRVDRNETIRRLKEIEKEMGRIRTADKYAPRIIDLDLVIWNGETVNDDFHRRNFLRKAVREIWPEVPR
jgi:2-amino-4-hydroxy-6-hydroxymethyldihydropteridine diphosphokinase